MLYCIENKNRDRIYIGAHWETKPAINKPLCFRTVEQAQRFAADLPDPDEDLVVCEVKWAPKHPKVWSE